MGPGRQPPEPDDAALAVGPFGLWELAKGAPDDDFASDDDSPPDSPPDQSPAPADQIEWRTGTYLDLFTPIYRELLKIGIKEHEARQMDITNVALLLGIAAPGPQPSVRRPSLAEAVADAPASTGEHAPATAPPGIPPPPWWRGDKAAFSTSTGAARELGMGFTERPS